MSDDMCGKCGRKLAVDMVVLWADCPNCDLFEKQPSSNNKIHELTNENTELKRRLAQLKPLIDDAWRALDSREDAPMLVNLDGLQEVVGRMKEVIEHE